MGTDNKAFAQWRKRMDYTRHEAAKALGTCVNTISNYGRGMRSDVSKVRVPKFILLACSALENGLFPVEYQRPAKPDKPESETQGEENVSEIG